MHPLERAPALTPRLLPGRSRLSAAASQPLHYPKWYRSQRTLLDKVTPSLCKLGTEELKAAFLFFPLFLAFSVQQHPKCWLQAAAAAAASAGLPCSVRKAVGPSASCYLHKYLQMFQGWDPCWAGNACWSGWLFARDCLAAEEQQMIPMDHSGWDKCFAEMTCGLQPTEHPFFLKKRVFSSY